MNGIDVSARYQGAVRSNAACAAKYLPYKEKLPDIIDLDLR
jgi:hypothetical protein